MELTTLFQEVVAELQIEPTNLKALKSTLVKAKYLQLRATEAAITTQGLIFLGQVLIEKEKVKKKIREQTEQRNATLQIIQKTHQLKSELRALKKQNKALEEKNQDMKDQIDLLDAFREEEQATRQQSASSTSEEDVATFKVAVQEEILVGQPTQPEPEEDLGDLSPVPLTRSRRESRLTVSISEPSVPPVVKTSAPSKRLKNRRKRPTASGGGTARAAESAPHPKPEITSVPPLSKSLDSVKVHNVDGKRSPRGPLHSAPQIPTDSPTPETTTVSPDPANFIISSNDEKKSSAEANENVFNENTVGDIIAGLTATVRERNWSDDMLLPKDYLYWYQFKLRLKKGQPLLKFKDFAPKVFSVIRKFYGIDDDAFLKSFSPENLKVVKGEGKSGAFFIFTKDRQFILKTALDSERDFLWTDLLPSYWQYTCTHKNTLLPRFYGIYSMKHEGIGGVTRFVIMNNVFNTSYEMIQKYDLKGSTLGRFVKPGDRKPGVILKDQDIKDLGKKICLAQPARAEFLRMLKKDSEFLARHKVMDYSLLLGIYYEEKGDILGDAKRLSCQQHQQFDSNPYRIKTLFQNMFQKEGNAITGVRPDGVTEHYFIGIIDILVQYGGRKRAESLLKSVVYSEEASVVPPDRYAERFQEFIAGLLPPDDEEEDSSSSEQTTSTVKRNTTKQ